MDDMDQEREPFPSSFLLCKVCDSLLAEPVSLPCGHTCCRTCLVKELRKAKECPNCRATCHTRAEDQPQNVMISQIAKTMFPEVMERRLRETEAEKAKFELCLPAFFYNVPVFPGQTLCLHFFEPRYKLMMRRIIDTSRRFAYVLPALGGRGGLNGGPKSHTALVAHVCEAEFLSDARVMVKTKLVGRHTIQDDLVEDGTGGLHYCQLQPFDDDSLAEGTPEARELKDLHEQATALCDGFLGPFKGQLVQAHGEMPADAVGLSMWMASFLPFYAPEKFALVQSRCTRRRLRACLRCAASMEALARASSRREEKTSVGDAAATADPQSPSSSSISLPALPPSPPPPSQPPAEAAAEAVAVAVAQAGPRGAEGAAATAAAEAAAAAAAAAAAVAAADARNDAGGEQSTARASTAADAQDGARGEQSTAPASTSGEQPPAPMATSAASAALSLPSSLPPSSSSSLSSSSSSAGPAPTDSSDDRWRSVSTEMGVSERSSGGWESR